MRDEVKLVLPTSWEPDRNEFLAALGVFRGGLGEQFFGPVYDALFVASIEVKGEFKMYYCVEYANLAEYLEIRYGVDLSEEDLETDRVFLVTWLPQVIDDAYEDNKLDTVLKSIKKLEEAQNEDQIRLRLKQLIDVFCVHLRRRVERRGISRSCRCGRRWPCWRFVSSDALRDLHCDSALRKKSYDQRGRRQPFRNT